MSYSNHLKYRLQEEHFKIMALVGNGFDLQVLNHFGSPATTSYSSFYHFLKMRGRGTGNLIIQAMEDSLGGSERNWSDIEEALEKLLDSRAPEAELKDSLNEVQREFSNFLNSVVNDHILNDLNQSAQDDALGRNSLLSLLRDIHSAEDLQKIPFGARKSNHDLYDFLFVNFNYTPLLENFVYLDQEQFNPKPHTTSDTNFVFDTNPRKLVDLGNWNSNSYSFIAYKTIHPHGYQDTPRSLLFGAGPTYQASNQTRSYAKSFLTQAELQYRPLIDETDLFIIFGCSLGKPDSWWWNSIARATLEADRKCAIMLYWWNSDPEKMESRPRVVEMFLDAAGIEDEDREAVSSKVIPISYCSNSERSWLSMQPVE